jgi:hypothetical protein
MNRLLVPIAALLLAACGPSANEPASGTPDPADVAAADAQPASSAATGAKSPAKAVQVDEGATATEVTVGASGYGAVQFGMAREEAEQAAKTAFGKNAIDGACEPKGAAPADVAYLFPDGKLQAIAVHTPGVMAEGGGRVGMDADEIRTLYAGKVSEKPQAGVPVGHVLKVTGFKNDAGLIFYTDAGGKVTGFRAGVGPALDAAACGGA